MKNKEVLILRVLVALLLLWLVILFLQCNGMQKSDATIKTPELNGKTELVKPESITVHDTIEVPKVIRQNLSKKEREFYESKINSMLEENQGLMDDFAQSNDSLRDVLYKKSIEVNSFTHTWENDTIKATVNGLSRGTVESIGLQWKVKSFSVDLPPQKEVKFRLLLGGGFGINKELSQPIYNAGGGWQNRKSNVFLVDYSKIGISEYVSAKAYISIFSIKGKKK